VRKIANIDAAVFDKYVGGYGIGTVPIFTITREGDHLIFTAPGQPRFEAFPESETVFFFKVIDAQVTFTQNEASNLIELVFEVNGRKIKAKKLAPAASK
jgi:hypothetical protein